MPKLLEFPVFQDHRGSLTVIEKILPFVIERVYYIYETNHLVRGGHRHVEGQQVLICLHGQCTVFVQDAQDFLLNRPTQGLLVASTDWHQIQFEPLSILLVLASNHYSPEDYIYD
jgi:hypothetical protein